MSGLCLNYKYYFNCQKQVYNQNDFANFSGFPKLVCPKAKAGKTFFGPVIPTKSSVWMSFKGQSDLEKPGWNFIHSYNLVLIQKDANKVSNETLGDLQDGMKTF